DTVHPTYLKVPSRCFLFPPMSCAPYTLLVNHLQYQIHGYPHLLPLYSFFFSIRSAISFCIPTTEMIQKRSSIENLYISPYDKYRLTTPVAYQSHHPHSRYYDESIPLLYRQTFDRYAVYPLHYSGVEIEYIFDRYACNLVSTST